MYQLPEQSNRLPYTRRTRIGEYTPSLPIYANYNLVSVRDPSRRQRILPAICYLLALIIRSLGFLVINVMEDSLAGWSNNSMVWNSSSKALEDDFHDFGQRNFQAGVLFALAGMGVILNLPIIVLLLVKRYRYKKSLRNIDLLILNLAVADILVAWFCALVDAIWKLTYQWLAGNASCKTVKFMQMFSLYASTFVITAISIDRCLVIANPLRSSQRSFVSGLIIAAWLLAALLSTPQIYIFRLEKAPFLIDGQELWQCCTHGAYSEPWQETAYVISTFAVIFAAPLLIIIASYAAVFQRLKQKADMPHSPHRHHDLRRSFSASESGRRRKQKMKLAKQKALLASVLVIAAFVICWTPYHCAMIYFVITRQETADDTVIINAVQHVFFFGMSNSVINPIIYGAFHFLRKSNRSVLKKNSRTQLQLGYRNSVVDGRREGTCLHRLSTI